jgi:hypothetical protein
MDGTGGAGGGRDERWNVHAGASMKSIITRAQINRTEASRFLLSVCTLSYGFQLEFCSYGSVCKA